MIYSLRNIRFPVTEHYDLKQEIGKKLGISGRDIELVNVIRKAVDTRRKNQPIYDYTVTIGNFLQHPDLTAYPPVEAPTPPPIIVSDPHPYIIGMGPAGLFCALALVKNGLKPVLFDQGEPLANRALRVQDFWTNGVLDECSNVQFGEGGAGAFSDGKLTSRNRDWYVQQVFSALISFGADETVGYEALPHLGTDGIREVVSRIRDYLQEQGCQFCYSSKLTDLELEQGKLKSIRINSEQHYPQTLILALGNSSRDTFCMLNRRGLAMEAKPFAVGVRIEQSQSRLNKSIYGSDKWSRLLGPATYRLTHKGTYTFCMCPGGYVIAASSERGGVVTNGMSYADRKCDRANSALVSTVDAKVFGSGLFDGMEYQQHLEQMSCRNTYQAPAQNVADFLSDKESERLIPSTYLPSVYRGILSTLYPQSLTDGLKSALLKFDSTITGFTDGAVVVGPETRTSSPVRILRDPENRCSVSCPDIYPIGEGSGYAGGIISSAADGFKVGLRIRTKI